MMDKQPTTRLGRASSRAPPRLCWGSSSASMLQLYVRPHVQLYVTPHVQTYGSSATGFRPRNQHHSWHRSYATVQTYGPSARVISAAPAPSVLTSDATPPVQTYGPRARAISA